ncbi:AAA family ATPase [Mycobacterium sp. SMC-2]|uniref:AAA family ATPase n=1 Tax=Mycobacterium TaxID=1763 RepID=UPI001CE133FA|nr:MULTISPECIES: AAA family ATPase [Mycobacterium]MCA4761174.1 AAA family ATPase [Mycobacterium avium subsp. hominissuis]UXA06493.1 AAA family ATPase [Mycobacterium sp. SMC-2]
MSAREYFDIGIERLGGGGAAGDQWGARKEFLQATEIDPGMCDAWMGLAVAGDVSAATLRGAYHATATLHRETRRFGLADSALAPTVPTVFLIDLYPHTPVGIALAYAATLIGQGDYDEAEKILDDIDPADEPAQKQIHRFVGATLHFLTRRWPDLLAWASRPAPANIGIVEAATRLLKGIGQTGLGQFEPALATLQSVSALAQQAMLDREATDTANLLAEAALYRGLCQRALGNEDAARKEFSAATVDGQLRPDAAAALDDPTYGPTVTTAEAIAARADRWDPDSGPSVADMRKARQRQEAGRVLERAERELEEFVGLGRVKEHVKELKFVKVYDQKMAERGVQIGERDTLHMTLVGPPGTAKTSIARLICEMYFGLGILESPEFIEVSRKDLVDEHIGGTEKKTSAVLQAARGRALLIDEAPELYKPDNERDFGHIAVDVIMKFAEDHRHDTMIAMAGYAGPMNRLLGANPGMRGRFPFQLEFSSYGADDLVKIAELFARRFHVGIDRAALSRFTATAEWLCSTPSTHPGDPVMLIDIAGNGRFARTVIEQGTRKAKARIAADPTVDLLTADLNSISTITVSDIDGALADVLAALELVTS